MASIPQEFYAESNKEANKILLENWSDNNTRTGKGIFVISEAIRKPEEEKLYVKILLVKSPNKEALSANVYIPLYEAFFTDLDALPEIFLKNDDLSVNTELGFTLLLMAIRNRKTKLVRILLHCGVDVNFRNEYGRTPLHLAAQFNNPELFQVLLNNGANVHAQDRHGYTPIHEAANSGNIEIIKLLLNEGADINVRTRMGIAPLYQALHSRRHATIRFLLEIGVDITKMSVFGKNLFTLFKVLAYANPEWLQRYIIKLRSAGFDVDKALLKDYPFGLTDFVNQCQSEIEAMKSELVSENISVFEILTNSVSAHSLRPFLGNYDIVRIDYKTKFPIYSEMIVYRIYYPKTEEMLDYDLLFFDCFSDELPILPYICRKMILSFLRYRDLKNILEVIRNK